MLSLGEFDFENYELHYDDPAVWILFICSTFIAQIMFLNMLIAVMGDTFDKVKEVEKQSALNETINFMADYTIAVPRYTAKEQLEQRFVFAIEPSELAENEMDDWDGTVTQLKRHFKQESDSVRSHIAKVDETLKDLHKSLHSQTISQESRIKSEIASVKSEITSMKNEILQAMT